MLSPGNGRSVSQKPECDPVILQKISGERYRVKDIRRKIFDKRDFL